MYGRVERRQQSTHAYSLRVLGDPVCSAGLLAVLPLQYPLCQVVRAHHAWIRPLGICTCQDLHRPVPAVSGCILHETWGVPGTPEVISLCKEQRMVLRGCTSELPLDSFRQHLPAGVCTVEKVYVCVVSASTARGCGCVQQFQTSFCGGGGVGACAGASERAGVGTGMDRAQAQVLVPVSVPVRLQLRLVDVGGTGGAAACVFVSPSRCVDEWPDG